VIRGALVLWTALLPTPAMGYVLATNSQGTAIRWPSDSVSFAISDAGAYTLPSSEKGLEYPTIRRAFLTWEAVPGSRLYFDYQGHVAEGSIPNMNDGLCGVRFYTSGVPTDLTDAIGVTLITFDDQSATIYDADMLFNERDYRFSTQGASGRLDLLSVVLHEVGHLVGMDHTCGANGEVQPSCYDPSLQQDPARYQKIVGAVMYPLRGINDPPLRALTDDDAQGISALYPASPPIPAPTPLSVTPRAASGQTTLTVKGHDFDPSATVRLYIDGPGSVAATVQSATAAQITASVDAAGLNPGCYDVLVDNPSHKEGALLGAISVGGAACRDLLTPPGQGCSCNSGASHGGALLVLALTLALRRRRTG
jgi:MYXO-CTERM domain-containing protein